MTALNSAILFNNSTGSDTTASGCGPATAVTITLQTSAGNNTANASGSLSSISAGDLMYVPSFTGRKFNVIASVQPLGGTITFDDNWDDSASGVSGYVGGKRATFDNADSRKVFDDLHGGWVIESETDQTITSPISPTGTGDIDNFAVIDLGGNTVTYTSSSNYPFTVQENCLLKNGTFIKTTGTPNGILVSGTANFSYGACYQIVMVGFNLGILVGANRLGYLYKCTAKNGSVGFSGYNTALNCEKCIATNNTAQGFYTNHTLEIQDCIAATNNVGFYSDGSTRLHQIVGSIAYSNTSHGLDANGSIDTCNGNIFASNGGYGINSAASKFVFTDSNAFYNNTSGNVSNQSFDSGNDITLTADPFVDAANGDFNISDSAGGGATLRANNFSINTDTAVYPFRQYVSDNFGSGGGGAVLHPLRSN